VSRGNDRGGDGASTSRQNAGGEQSGIEQITLSNPHARAQGCGPRGPAMRPADQKIHVVLADDHELIRSGIRSLLARMTNVEVIADVGDGLELLELLDSVRPDLVITDIAMPGMDGITAVSRIKASYPDLRVIMLSMTDSAEAVKRAVASGADGFVRKDAPGFELELAVRNVMAVGSYFGKGVAERLMAPGEPSVDEQLTERQIQILTLLASGKSSKEVAFELDLSSKTVDAHRTRIMERLHLNDLASLTLYAVRKGLVKP
jgi:two-component system, NarL family, nitrate/nitrite response regulator NarL